MHVYVYWRGGGWQLINWASGGIVSYFVIQAYDSLVLEVLDICCISWVCTVPSSSQPKKLAHSWQWGLLGEDLGIFQTYEVRIVKGPGKALGYLFQDLSAQPWSKVGLLRAVKTIGLPWETSHLGPIDVVPFHEYCHRGATGKHAYIMN